MWSRTDEFARGDAVFTTGSKKGTPNRPELARRGRARHRANLMPPRGVGVLVACDAIAQFARLFGITFIIAAPVVLRLREALAVEMSPLPAAWLLSKLM